LRELRDAPLGGHCGEMMQLEGREPIINTAIYHLRHPNVLHEKERFWLEESMEIVRR
jgi:hypothetical protein